MIQLEQPTRVKVPSQNVNSVFLPLISAYPETNKPIVILKGGRGSGKSRAIAQRLLRQAGRKKMRVGLVRKVKDTIKESQWREIQLAAEAWKIDSLIRFVVSPLEIRMPNGTLMIARGLDDPLKIKSLAEMDLIWIEEATELTAHDWLTLSLSVRGRGFKQIIISYNPTYGSWLNEEFYSQVGELLNPDGVYSLHTTFRDNKFRGDDFDKKLEKLRLKDPELYKIHADGLLVQLKGLIYPKYKIIDEFPALDAFNYGVDPGFNDPFAVVKCAFKDNVLYWDEVLYVREHTKPMALKKLMEQGEAIKKEWRIDDSEPDAELEFRQKGFNAFPAKKGKIKDGIDKIKSVEMICITRRSVNLLREIAFYKWMEDNDGNTLDEPVDFDNHCLDGARYGSINLIQGRFKIKSHNT